MAENRVKTTPKDFFLNLLAMVALYMSAIGFATLLFQYINYLFPDPLEYISVNASSVRFAIASLIILFPVYVLTLLYMQRGYQKEPARKEVAVRKWMVYFTLFATALLIIGDFVALVMRFLEGELTTRFLLKVVAILFVAGMIFGYYLWDLKEKKDRKPAKGLAYGVSALVLFAIIGSFAAIGSPAEQRMKLFDERRISDLQQIQANVINFWQSKDRLPAELAEMEDDLRGVTIPTDPATEEDYEYNILGDESFELCAEFDTSSDNNPNERFYYPYGSESWEHDAGRFCFERTIDPDFYEIKPQPTAVR